MKDIKDTIMTQLNSCVDDMLSEFDVANNYIIDQRKADYTRNELNKIQINIDYWLRSNYEENWLAYYDDSFNASE